MGQGGEPGKTGGPATPPPGSFTLNQMRLVRHLTVCVPAGEAGEGRARPGVLGPHPLRADRGRSRKRGGRNLDSRSAGTVSQKSTVHPARGTRQGGKASPPRPTVGRERARQTVLRSQPSAPHTFVKHLLCAGFRPCRAEHSRALPRVVSSGGRGKHRLGLRALEPRVPTVRQHRAHLSGGAAGNCECAPARVEECLGPPLPWVGEGSCPLTHRSV